MSSDTKNPCHRCGEPRSNNDHLCQDLKDTDYDPFKMEICVHKIEELLDSCRSLSDHMDTPLGVVNETAEKKIIEFQTRIDSCIERLAKLYAYYASYQFNEWDLTIANFETECKALEKRAFGS